MAWKRLYKGKKCRQLGVYICIYIIKLYTYTHLFRLCVGRAKTSPLHTDLSIKSIRLFHAAHGDSIAFRRLVLTYTTTKLAVSTHSLSTNTLVSTHEKIYQARNARNKHLIIKKNKDVKIQFPRRLQFARSAPSCRFYRDFTPRSLCNTVYGIRGSHKFAYSYTKRNTSFRRIHH